MTLEEKVPANILTAASCFLTGLALVSVCAWIYAIYYFIWTSARPFESGFQILFFICVPPVIAVFAFASSRLKPSSRVAVATVCLATAASLYLGEALLRLIPWLLDTAGPITISVEGASPERKTKLAQHAASFGVNFDTRDRIEALADAQTRGFDVVPAIYPSALLQSEPNQPLTSVIRIQGAEILPLGGIANKVTLLCNETGDYIFYPSDEHGFHNPRGIWRSHSLDLAIVGDSFAHGFCVRPEQHFIALLRKHYPATLSLGMGGHGPLLELASLKEFLPALKPKIVVWAYFEKNDLDDLSNETRSPLLLRYLQSGFRQELLSKQAEIDEALLAHAEKETLQTLRNLHQRKKRHDSWEPQTLIELAKLTLLRSRIGLIATQRADVKPYDMKANRALFRSILWQAKTNVESWGGSLYFVYLPQWERYASSRPMQESRAEILRIATDLRIPSVDFHAIFLSHADPLAFFPFRLSGHYNADGNRVIAETMLKQLPPSVDARYQ